MRLGFFSLALIAVLFTGFASAAGAAALVSDMPKNLEIGETPSQLVFSVYNDSAIEQALEITYSIPSDFDVLRQPSKIGAGKSEEVILDIYPDYSLEGTTYQGKINIDLGGNRAEKTIELIYKKENNCPAGLIAQNNGNGSITLTAANNSYKDKTIVFKELNNVPSDWKLEGPKSFTLQGFEEKSFNYTLKGNSTFKGEAELVFECNNIILRTSVPETENEPMVFSGLFIFGDAGYSPDFEIILNVFLGIVAAVLLIAFIARLVRVLHSNKQTKIEVKK